MQPYSVFIGDVSLDEYYQAPYWPALKDKVGVTPLRPQFGGMIANAACVFAALGESVRFMGVLNRGAVSQRLLENLEQSGVDTGLMLFDDALPDSKCIIVLAEGEHTVFYPEMNIERLEITPEQLEILAGARFVYSTRSDTLRLTCGSLSNGQIIAHIRAGGAKLVYDLDVGYLPSEDEAYYQHMDIAFFNEIGFNSYRKGRTEAQAAADLLSYGTEAVVVTFAEKGCVIYSQNRRLEVPALSVEVVDVTGAGDTFCSSFLFAYGKTGDLEYAARFACAAAAICVGALGGRAGAVGETAVLQCMR
jgi:sugar/nucleoside kinase (ribokinase family)